MIRQINYNFNDLIEDCSDIIDHPNNANLLSLKRDLNKFFKDSTCTDITYTQNDAMFFGMCVLPITDKEIINAILQDDKSIRFNKYSIEIDSRLILLLENSLQCYYMKLVILLMILLLSNN